MSYNLIGPEAPQPAKRSSGTMEIGDIAIVRDKGCYTGQVILRHYEGLVSLTKPSWTWTHPGAFADVRVLQPGECITLVVK